MFSKKRFLLVNKLNIVIVLLIVIIYLCPITLSKYESSSTGGAKGGIAYYVVDANYQTDNVYLDSLVPSNTPYTFTFSISNFDSDNHIAETDLTYDLSIVTTTNLPLKFNLYLDNGNQSIIVDDKTDLDDYNTYFRTLSIDRVYLTHDDPITYTYTLSILFDSVYDNYKYQDIIESIRIIIDSKQVIEEDNSM